ncbi:DMT family transporter [Pseudorhodoferax sp. Leaf274]|uniref:DMT family transporter n=1 Tax=Pseudorhodoferax sp. Leaf274 TaxID=1736318 RepID=UPI001F34FA91|nr:DMT family transporter [Pseudorhodoferax sp. Leaf274]
MKKNGVVLHVLGLWVLSSLDASGKYLALLGVPVLLVAWVRYAVHTALSSAILLPRHGRGLLRTHSLRGQLLRGALMVASTLLFFSVLQRVPLAEATAMNFMAPVFLMALAPWLLHEPHRLHRWLGVVLGFAGMLLVVRPGAGLDTVGVLLGVATALTFAAFQIATRRLAADAPLTTNYYGGLFGTVALTPLLPWVWQLPPLSPVQWALLLSTGITGAIGHGLQSAAYARTPATLLAPYSYLQILSAAALGWAVFGQLPDATTALGIACICGAGIAVALVERRLNRRVEGRLKGPMRAAPAPPAATHSPRPGPMPRSANCHGPRSR